MSKRLQTHQYLIHFLISDISPKQLRTVLNSLEQEQVNALTEIIANVLYGNIPISNHFKAKLKSYKGKLLQISDPKTNWTKRKSIISKNPHVLKTLLLAAKDLLKSVLR